ncbi:hypothetical protein Agub_g1365, partial [Astrephomene gubernaculifera]
MTVPWLPHLLAFGLLAISLGHSLAETHQRASQLEAPAHPLDALYGRAIALRSKRSPTWQEQQKAVELLVAATGFRSRRLGKAFPFNGTVVRGSGQASHQDADVALPGYDNVVHVSKSAHRGALRELAKAFQDGLGVSPDLRLSLELFRAAAAAGDPEAHGAMGVRLALGLDGADSWDAEGIVGFGQPKPQEALLHYYLGAAGGDMAARMALGYRHAGGLGVPRACWSAAAYYLPVGEQVSNLAAGMPATSSSGSRSSSGSSNKGRPSTPPNAADEASTEEGEEEDDDMTRAAAAATAAAAASGGHSVTTPGAPKRPARASQHGSLPSPGAGAEGKDAGADEGAEGEAAGGLLPHVERIRLHLAGPGGAGGLRGERHRDVVQYYQVSADRGNREAQTAVGQVLNYGTHGIDRDHAAALSYFKLAAGVDSASDSTAGGGAGSGGSECGSGDIDAMAHLGSMYANGYGTARSYAAALKWWGCAAKRNHGSALFGLGYLYLTGRGVERDYDRAFTYFSRAAEQMHSDARPDALFFMGVLHLRGLGVRRKSAPRAHSYFTLAAHSGHALAAYNAAVMHLGGRGTPRNCKPALTMLKSLAERGPAAAFVQSGHEHFFRGRSGPALWAYLRAAELGLEVAQSNAAWMLERGYASGPHAAELAFSLYRQSAAQGNVHSLLALGDAHFYGRGVGQDWVRAAALYYEAYQERSPEAMFNLGFMHEFGAGVPRDLQLAARFYSMAKHTQADAALPVALASAWLHLHGWWEALLPHLPARLQPLAAHLFALTPPHTSPFGPWLA